MYATSQIKELQSLTTEYLQLADKKETGKIDIEKLRSVLRFHEYRYYIVSDPLIADYEFDVLGYHSDAIDLRIHTDLLVKMIVPDAIDTIFTDQIIDLEKLVWITDVSDMRVFA